MDEILGYAVLAGVMVLLLFAERSKPRRLWWK
jgi:hypothetical protein